MCPLIAELQIQQLIQAAQRLLALEGPVADIAGAQSATGLEREVINVLEEALHEALRWHHQPHVIRVPPQVHRGIRKCTLERIRSEVGDDRPGGNRPVRLVDRALLDRKRQLPVVYAYRIEHAAGSKVHDLPTRAFFFLALEVRHEVIAIQMHTELLAVGAHAVLGRELLFYVRGASRRRQCRHPVFLAHDVVVDRAGLDGTRPPDYLRHTHATFPGRAFLAADRGWRRRPAR